jgi:hypothetical protein
MRFVEQRQSSLPLAGAPVAQLRDPSARAPMMLSRDPPPPRGHPWHFQGTGCLCAGQPPRHAGTQASTSASLQQVVEGLCPWTAADRNHRSKDWPIFDGQGLNYITWKREWKAHHKENYPGLKVDALRVLVEQRLWWPQTRIASGTSHPWIRSGSTWIGPT